MGHNAMQLFLYYMTGLAPYLLAALLLGGVVAAMSPWVAKSAQRWLLFICHDGLFTGHGPAFSIDQG